MALVAIVMIHPLRALTCRSDRRGWWRLPPNHIIPASFLTLLVVQLLAVSWTPLASLLGTVRLSLQDWMVIALAVAWAVALLEGIRRPAHPRQTSGMEASARRA